MALIKQTEKSSEKPMMPRDYMSRPKRRRMVADTEPGAVDDDAGKRIKDRRKMLEEAAG